MKTLVICCALVLCACAQSKPKADPKLNDRPEAAEALALPEGPPIVRSSDSEPVAENGEPAEGDGLVSRADLDSFLNRGPSYVLTIVEVEPMHAAKGFVGYQVTKVSTDARAFMTPQLRVGDIVTHVNGVRLLTPGDYMQAWRSLDKVSLIRVDFTRKSEPMHALWTVK